MHKRTHREPAILCFILFGHTHIRQILALECRPRATISTLFFATLVFYSTVLSKPLFRNVEIRFFYHVDPMFCKLVADPQYNTFIVSNDRECVVCAKFSFFSLCLCLTSFMSMKTSYFCLFAQQI